MNHSSSILFYFSSLNIYLFVFFYYFLSYFFYSLLNLASVGGLLAGFTIGTYFSNVPFIFYLNHKIRFYIIIR